MENNFLELFSLLNRYREKKFTNNEFMYYEIPSQSNENCFFSNCKKKAKWYLGRKKQLANGKKVIIDGFNLCTEHRSEVINTYSFNIRVSSFKKTGCAHGLYSVFDCTKKPKTKQCPTLPVLPVCTYHYEDFECFNYAKKQ